jgi:two-component system chemotaxis response regulator CheB
MTADRLIVVGGSAGAVEALRELARRLPADLPAAVCVVVHFPSSSSSYLPDILRRAGRLPARHAVSGEVLQPGVIYVAPPDHHLLVNGGRLLLSRGPRQNGHRPAVDPLFRTAARAYGPALVGVVLSGTLDDGAVGLAAIKAHGGLAVVQHPDEAMFDGMPRAALDMTRVDYVAPSADLAPLLTRLAAALPGAILPPQEEPLMTGLPDESQDARVVAEDKAALEQGGRSGQPSILTSPDFGGTVWELNHGGVLRYRCHVGHAYAPDSLEAAHTEALEGALWTAVRTLEENAALARRLAHRARQQDNERAAAIFDERADMQAQRADIVRTALASQPGGLPARADQAAPSAAD